MASHHTDNRIPMPYSGGTISLTSSWATPPFAWPPVLGTLYFLNKLSWFLPWSILVASWSFRTCSGYCLLLLGWSFPLSPENHISNWQWLWGERREKNGTISFPLSSLPSFCPTHLPTSESEGIFYEWLRCWAPRCVASHQRQPLLHDQKYC